MGTVSHLVAFVCAVAQPVPSEPHFAITGMSSAITKPTFRLVADGAALERIWAAHINGRDERQDVQVRFKDREVIALFQGNDIEADGLTQFRIVSWLGYRVCFYRKSKLTRFDEVVTCAPYALLVVDRSRAPTLVVQSITGDFGKVTEHRIRAVLKTSSK